MNEGISQNQLRELLEQFCGAVLSQKQLRVREIILFGSYARGTADPESDVDLMVLTDLPREQLAGCVDTLVDITVELGLKYGVSVSPVMQNYDFYMSWSEDLPFYRNIQNEGVKVHAA